jgi:gamma-glutamyltranspeptidase/glutathione hydrolase
MDMPGRDRALGGGAWDVSTEYGGGVDITIGPGSVAAHGSLAAFDEAHRRDGSLPWRELVAPALDVARGGFRLSSASRYYLEHVHDDVFGWDDDSRAALHGPDGEVTTDPVVLPDLVRSLALIAEEGASSLHTGELARMVTDDVLGRGGILGPDDLASYRPVVRPSLLTRIGGWTLATTPPPTDAPCSATGTPSSTTAPTWSGTRAPSSTSPTATTWRCSSPARPPTSPPPTAPASPAR